MPCSCSIESYFSIFIYFYDSKNLTYFWYKVFLDNGRCFEWNYAPVIKKKLFYHFSSRSTIKSISCCPKWQNSNHIMESTITRKLYIIQIEGVGSIRHSWNKSHNTNWRWIFSISIEGFNTRCNISSSGVHSFWWKRICGVHKS